MNHTAAGSWVGWPVIPVWVFLLALGGALGDRPAVGAVTESTREVPLVKEVDVLVVGGSSGAVSAAMAAAEAGARVYLMTPKSYLGEDMCATLRLWLEDGERPVSLLARKIFAEPDENEPVSPLEGAAYRDPNALDFTYESSLPSVMPHKDTIPPSLLKDGLCTRSESQSVQYNGDVILTADLGKSQDVNEARMVLYHRGGGDFNPATVAISTSDDRQRWQPAGTHGCGDPRQGIILVTQPMSGSMRYVRFEVKRVPGAKRVLLGEITLVGSTNAAALVQKEKKSPFQFSPPANSTNFVKLAKPMQVKRTLDEALLTAKVDFLFGTYPSDLITDESGKPCGVVMANRTGRQAVLAKVIIDATPTVLVARLAGASVEPYPAGEQTFYRVVMGGDPKVHPKLTARKTGLFFKAVGDKGLETNRVEVIEYALRLPMRDGSFASFAEAEQLARDLTFHPAQLAASDELFQVPPHRVRGVKSQEGAWPGVAALDLDAFRPAGTSRLYILGGLADISRGLASSLSRPLALMDMGQRVGLAAAAEARSLGLIKSPRVSSAPAFADALRGESFAGEIRETLVGLRPAGKKNAMIPSAQRSLPVLGMYDVIVVGGGTGGAPAGIGAGRGGARTLLIEYLHGLGGVGTLGLIGKYYYGFMGGFTAEAEKGIKQLQAANYVVGKAEWWRLENRRAGTEMWFGVLGCGALVEQGVVKGVVVATSHGRGVVLAKTVIDASGNADIAAVAGARCVYTEADDVGVQGSGLPPLELGAYYSNTDWTFADDTDVVDFWHHFILARQKFRHAYDLGQLVDTRERRRIVGDITISPMDIILGRTWPDAVVFSKSNFDSHGFTVHPVFVAMPPDKRAMSVFVPLRALLPQGLEGLVCLGLGASAHRDAMPVIRMQADIQNQGYACGRAASMVAATAATIRQVDIKELQKHLVAMGCLPEKVLTDRDLLPLPAARVAQAVKEVVEGAPDVEGVVKNREALAVIFAQPWEALGPLVQAHASSTGDPQLAYAHILAMLGSRAGADTLVAKIKAMPDFDSGWRFKAGGQYGRSLSELDSFMVALGHTGDPRITEVVLEKVKLLDAAREFSHHRACAMALEMIGDPRAAEPLAGVLAKPGMTGHATLDIDEARRQMRPGRAETGQRNDSLRELILARALYRCGDHHGLGEKILREYAADLRGHYARHAQAVLEAGRKK